MSLLTQKKTALLELQARRLLAGHANLTQTILALQELRLRYLLISGAYVSLLNPGRKHADFDILVADSDIKTLSNHLGYAVNAKEIVNTHDKNNYPVRITTDELHITGNTPINCSANGTVTCNGNTCSFYLTDQMWQRRISLRTQECVLHIADPADVLLHKAMLQRHNEKKQDTTDMKTIANALAIDENYLKMRIQEVDADQRIVSEIRQVVDLQLA